MWDEWDDHFQPNEDDAYQDSHFHFDFFSLLSKPKVRLVLPSYLRLLRFDVEIRVSTILILLENLCASVSL